MIAFYVLPLYILANVLMYISLIRWMKSCSEFFSNKIIKYIIIGVQTFFASALFIGFLLPSGALRRTFNFIGNYWLGVMIYALMVDIVVLVAWLILSKTLFKKDKTIKKSRFHVALGFVAIATIIGISIYGVINARIIRTTNYEVNIEKSTNNLKELNVVMVADTHLGYNIGYKHMERMVEKINAQNPDIVIIAGDIFDNEYDAIDNPEKVKQALLNISSKYGVYAVYGNHDVSEKVLAGFTFNYNAKKVSDLRMDELLKESNVTLLRDEAILIDNEFYIYGRPDYKKLGRGIDIRKTPEEITQYLDKTKPIIVVDHEPKELEKLAEAGVDLDLSGHTHDGQIFPLNLIGGLVYENPCGLKNCGNMKSIVTSGVGIYGPNMRVGTIAEITNIKVNFK